MYRFKKKHLLIQLVQNNPKPFEGALQANMGEPADKTALIEVLHRSNGNPSQAARLLGINRVTVWTRKKK